MKPTAKNTTVAASGPLQAAATTANHAIDSIVATESKFASETLPDRIAIGLACLQAHAAFAAAPTKRNAAGKNQHTKEVSSRRELASPKSPRSFTEWLAISIPRLKEPVAYKYMKAASGLGMIDPADASRKNIVASLQAWEKSYGEPATLSALIAATTLRIEDKKQTPVPVQSEFDFWKETVSSAREAAETVIGLKDELPEDFRRAAAAQFYTALFELTGTHWKPSDEAPDLANVDPSSLNI